MIKALPDAKLGPLRIWEPPKAGMQYVIGGDVAEGVEGGDYSVGWVIEAYSKRHVATWHGTLEPWFYTDELALLGEYFNWALLAPEVNNHGHTVIEKLVHEIQYPNLYQPSRRHDQKKDPGKKKGGNYGWRTTEGSKRRIMDMLRTVVQLNLPIHDDRFYREGLTYTKNDRGLGEASEGAYDDTLMAAGIAYCVASEVYAPIRVEKVKIKQSEEDRAHNRRVEDWRKILEATAHAQNPTPVSHESLGAPAELL